MKLWGTETVNMSRTINPRRLELIDNYLRAPMNEYYPIAFRGQRTKLPVIRAGTRDLCYNIELGRLIIDRLTIIEIDGDRDPEDPVLQEEIERRILAFKETDLLKRLIKRDGQLEPGVVTADGYVINGNRRLAVLRSLARETGEDRFAYMDVAVLPEDATRPELYLLEATMQMTPETRVRYGPVTTMLQIRRGLQELGLEKERLAEAMNMEVEELERHLERLALMDEYLAFIGRPGEFHLLEEGREEEGREGRGKNQHFIEIQNIKKQYERASYWEAFLRHLFLLVAKGTTFDDIRKIKTWRPDGVQHYIKTVNELSPAGGESRLGQVASDDPPVEALATTLEDLTTTLGSSTGQPVPGLRVPTAVTDDWKTAAELAFEQTVEDLENRKRSQEPAQLLQQALRKLEAVNLHGARRAGRQSGHHVPLADLRDLLTQIAARIDELRRDLERIQE